MASNAGLLRVEHEIPMPRRQEVSRKYPFRKMQVGDSFFVPCESWKREETMWRLSSPIRWATYKTGFRFAQRAVLEGVRVWRVS